MTSIMPEAPSLIPSPRPVPAGRPRILDSTVPVDALPHVEIRDGKLIVTFPEGCRYNAEERKRFAEQLVETTERTVRERQLAKARERGLI